MASTTQDQERTPLQWATACHERMKGNSGIYDILLQDITLVSAERCKIVAHLPVAQVHVNSRGTLHGAVSATITDWAGGMAIATTGRDKTGVSTDIHVSYVSSAKVGDLLVIEASASKVGGTLAFTSINIRKENGDVVATGTHTKYVKVA